jgi:hypothetical protein
MKTLATRARTVLAGGRRALLTLPRHDVRGWTGLIDDGGEPVLLVGAGSPPTAAAGTVRRCRIDVPGAAGERLVLAGVLRAVPGTAEQVARRIAGPGLTVVVPYDGADGLAALALSVHEVVLCLPAAPSGARGRAARQPPGDTDLRWPPTATGRKVDLTAYALAEPDLIAAYAPDLIDHLNAEHTHQLHQLVSHGVPVAPGHADRLGGAPEPATVAGVQVGALDRTGLTLWQVGADGADELRVTFRTPLTEPRSLGLELRWLLTHGARRPE